MPGPKTMAERRYALGLTQRQLADVWEVSDRFVKRLEAAGRQPQRIYDLAMEATEAHAAVGLLHHRLAAPGQSPHARPRRRFTAGD